MYHVLILILRNQGWILWTLEIAFCLGREQIRKRVGELDSDSKWKAFVTKKYGVVDNILNILEICYEHYAEYIKEEIPSKSVLTILGKKHSQEWNEFQFCVIQKLLNPKDYNVEYDYEDTAGGCDEVVWDTGRKIIDER